MAHYKSEVERLERRQRQLEVLFEELRVKTGEDFDEEDEVGDEEDEVGDSEALLRLRSISESSSVRADRINDASEEEE